MFSRYFILSLTLSFLLNLSSVAKDKRPNVILILVDDLGKEWVSCYGAEDIQTPQIDALAESGVRFENFYVMPQCTPTRLSLLTGQYPYRHGWVNHWDVPRWGGRAHFDEQLNPCIGIEMKKAGYQTCIAGKWQIDDFRVEPDALKRCGFDSWCMWTGYESGVRASSKRYQDPYIFSNGESETRTDQFGPDVFSSFIVNFIHKNKDKPFFVYYPMVLTHTPLVSTPDEQANSPLGKHKAMVRYTDKITGKILKALEDENIRDNTLVIWTTDNGTTRSIKGTRNGVQIKGGKSQTSENGICVPFIVSWPKHLKSQQVSDALIDITDIYPTLTDLAGIPLPKKNKQEGISFAKLLKGRSQDSKREWIMSMGGQNNARLTDQGVENQYVFRDRVVRNKRYKLWIGTDRSAKAFYDLTADPQEQKNILDRSLSPKEKRELQKLKNTNKNFPLLDMDPVYRPNPPQEWDVEIGAKSQVWKRRY